METLNKIDLGKKENLEWFRKIQALLQACFDNHQNTSDDWKLRTSHHIELMARNEAVLDSGKELTDFTEIIQKAADLIKEVDPKGGE